MTLVGLTHKTLQPPSDFPQNMLSYSVDEIHLASQILSELPHVWTITHHFPYISSLRQPSFMIFGVNIHLDP